MLRNKRYYLISIICLYFTFGGGLLPTNNVSSFSGASNCGLTSIDRKISISLSDVPSSVLETNTPCFNSYEKNASGVYSTSHPAAVNALTKSFANVADSISGGLVMTNLDGNGLSPNIKELNCSSDNRRQDNSFLIFSARSLAFAADSFANDNSRLSLSDISPLDRSEKNVAISPNTNDINNNLLDNDNTVSGVIAFLLSISLYEWSFIILGLMLCFNIYRMQNQQLKFYKDMSDILSQQVIQQTCISYQKA